MNNLITINNDSQTISARELHEKLNIKTAFKDWLPRMSEYGFIEGTDFNMLKNERVQYEGDREVKRMVTDAEISMDMAKQICMIQRTPEGKEIRQYLIDLEKAWNTPEQIMARALTIAQQTIERRNFVIKKLEEDTERMRPKEEFYDAVAGSKTAIEMAAVAKVLNFNGIGRNKLFEILRDEKILQNDNIPYQKYIDNGWFRTIEQKYSKDGETYINIKTLVYQKGVDGIRKILEKR